MQKASVGGNPAPRTPTVARYPSRWYRCVQPTTEERRNGRRREHRASGAMRTTISTSFTTRNIPMEELAPGAWSHLVAGKEAVVSFPHDSGGDVLPRSPACGGADYGRGRRLHRPSHRREDVPGERWRRHRHAVKHPARRLRPGPGLQGHRHIRAAARGPRRTCSRRQRPGWRSRTRRTRISGQWARTSRRFR